jgi:hypothetical protein
MIYGDIHNRVVYIFVAVIVKRWRFDVLCDVH